MTEPLLVETEPGRFILTGEGIPDGGVPLLLLSGDIVRCPPPGMVRSITMPQVNQTRVFGRGRR